MRSLFISVLSSVLLLSIAPLAVSCGLSNHKELNPTKRPAEWRWMIRHFIYVDDFESLEIGIGAAEEALEEEQNDPRPGMLRPFKHLFTPRVAVRLPPIDLFVREIGIVQIEFDRNGRVTTENTSGKRLQGRIDDRNCLILEPEQPADGPPFHLADRFLGKSDLMRKITPAFCSIDDYLRYRKGFDGSRYGRMGNFGCREWSFQLLDKKRPYIDVTSYEGKEAVIKAFYGWAPFDGPRKPVIGMHAKTWVCLLDCPQGAAPGIIVDIAKWCKENGFPIPKRPKKNPMFPDAALPYD